MGAHYQNSNISTHFLETFEVANIVSEEMQKLGYEWVFNNRIVKVNDSVYINTLCYSEKSNIGFLYETKWGMVPQQKNRYVESLYKEDTGNSYAEKIIPIDGKATFIILKELPKNLHILKAENYWYQTSTDQTIDDTLVSKDFIVELLRQDIRRIAPILVHNSKRR